MTSNASPNPSPGQPPLKPPLRLRQPRLLFGTLALITLFAVGLVLFVFAGSHFSGFALAAIAPLSWPAGLGALLTATALAPRLERGTVMRRRDIARRAGFAFAAAGFAWPLAFGLAALLEGDASQALYAFAPALAGALTGAVAGLLGGTIAGALFVKRGA